MLLSLGNGVQVFGGSLTPSRLALLVLLLVLMLCYEHTGHLLIAGPRGPMEDGQQSLGHKDVSVECRDVDVNKTNSIYGPDFVSFLRSTL